MLCIQCKTQWELRVYKRGTKLPHLQITKNHIKQVILKLSRACHAVRFSSHVGAIDTTKSVYFTYSHFCNKCGMIFGG